MKFKRKLQNRTDYRKRLKLLSYDTHRLVIRISSKHILAQIVEYKPSGDQTIVSAHTRELSKLGYKGGTRNTPAAYLIGLLIAKKAKEKSISKAIPDIGFRSRSSSVLFSILKGAKDNGLDLKLDEKVIPKIERISGNHISALASKSSNKWIFSKYKIKPEELPKHFEDLKNRVGT